MSFLDDVLDDSPLELEVLELPEHLHAAGDASAMQRPPAPPLATALCAAPRPRRRTVTIGTRS